MKGFNITVPPLLHRRKRSTISFSSSPFAVYDYLNLAENDKIKKMLQKHGKGAGETVHFSDHVIKINRRSKEQKRVLLITNIAVYNVDPKKFSCKRQIHIQNLGLVISSIASDEFILRVPAEYDYHLRSAKRDKAVGVLVNLYKHLAAANNWQRKSLEHKWQHGKLKEMVVTRMKTQTLQAFQAIETNDEKKLEFYIGKGADINETQHGKTCLHEAAARNHMKVAKLLIARRAMIDARDNGGSTSLHVASEKGYLSFARLLLKAKAEINTKDYVGRTPLHLSSVKGQTDVIQLLLCSMANVNAVDTEDQTPMHLACVHGIASSVRVLLQARAKLDKVDRFGATCRVWAKFAGQPKILHFLDNADMVLAKEWEIVSNLGAKTWEIPDTRSNTVHQYKQNDTVEVLERRGNWVLTTNGWLMIKRDTESIAEEKGFRERHTRASSMPDLRRQIFFDKMFGEGDILFPTLEAFNAEREHFEEGETVALRFLERHLRHKLCAARVQSYSREKYDLELLPHPANTLEVKHIVVQGVPYDNVVEAAELNSVNGGSPQYPDRKQQFNSSMTPGSRNTNPDGSTRSYRLNSSNTTSPSSARKGHARNIISSSATNLKDIADGSNSPGGSIFSPALRVIKESKHSNVNDLMMSPLALGSSSQGDGSSIKGRRRVSSVPPPPPTASMPSLSLGSGSSRDRRKRSGTHGNDTSLSSIIETPKEIKLSGNVISMQKERENCYMSSSDESEHEPPPPPEENGTEMADGHRDKKTVGIGQVSALDNDVPPAPPLPDEPPPLPDTDSDDSSSSEDADVVGKIGKNNTNSRSNPLGNGPVGKVFGFAVGNVKLNLKKNFKSDQTKPKLKRSPKHKLKTIVRVVMALASRKKRKDSTLEKIPAATVASVSKDATPTLVNLPAVASNKIVAKGQDEKMKSPVTDAIDLYASASSVILPPNGVETSVDVLGSVSTFAPPPPISSFSSDEEEENAGNGRFDERKHDIDKPEKSLNQEQAEIPQNEPSPPGNDEAEDETGYYNGRRRSVLEEVLEQVSSPRGIRRRSQYTGPVSDAFYNIRLCEATLSGVASPPSCYVRMWIDFQWKHKSFKGSFVYWPAKKKTMKPSWFTSRALYRVPRDSGLLRMELFHRVGDSINVKDDNLLGSGQLPLEELRYGVIVQKELSMENKKYSATINIERVPVPSRAKFLFFVRHGQSEWNAAKEDKAYVSMLKQIDHPLTMKGRTQAEQMTKDIDDAIAELNGLGMAEKNENLSEPQQERKTFLEQFLSAEAILCSPLTRAVQTACIGLSVHPCVLERGVKITLYSDCREKRNFGGRDTTSKSSGKEIVDRVRRKLMKIYPNYTTQHEKFRRVANMVDTGDATDVWWNTEAETKKKLHSRIQRLLLHLRYTPESSIILVGHSHFFRVLIGSCTSEEFKQRNPILTETLKSAKLDHCAVAAVVIDFGEDESHGAKIEDFRFLFKRGKLLRDKQKGPESDAKKSKLKKTNWREFYELVLAESVNDAELVHGSVVMRESRVTSQVL